MSAPLVGITTRRLGAAMMQGVPAGVRDAELDAVFADYSDSVSGAGGVPVLITRSAAPGLVIERLDGLVLSGGEDVEPSRYGRTPGPHATSHDAGRDDFEMSLVQEAVSAGLPILAICRGVQVLNVALGGTLIGHLEPQDGLDHSATDEHRSARRHLVTVQPGCTLAVALAGDLDETSSVAVNSYHHQAIDEPAPGLAVVARAPDGTIEAVEDASRRVVGVQWHPEMHAGVDPVFTWFIRYISEGKQVS